MSAGKTEVRVYVYACFCYCCCVYVCVRRSREEQQGQVWTEKNRGQSKCEFDDPVFTILNVMNKKLSARSHMSLA